MVVDLEKCRVMGGWMARSRHWGRDIYAEETREHARDRREWKVIANVLVRLSPEALPAPDSLLEKLDGRV